MRERERERERERQTHDTHTETCKGRRYLDYLEGVRLNCQPCVFYGNSQEFLELQKVRVLARMLLCVCVTTEGVCPCAVLLCVSLRCTPVCVTTIVCPCCYQCALAVYDQLCPYC